MRHVLRAFFQNARKPGGLSGRIMLWAMNWGHASLAKWGRSHVSPEPDARVLDIGCGGGANLAQFLKLCPQGSVCGIDFSAESVATSLRKNAGAVAAGLKIPALPPEVRRLLQAHDVQGCGQTVSQEAVFRYDRDRGEPCTGRRTGFRVQDVAVAHAASFKVPLVSPRGDHSPGSLQRQGSQSSGSGRVLDANLPGSSARLFSVGLHISSQRQQAAGDTFPLFQVFRRQASGPALSHGSKIHLRPGCQMGAGVLQD